MKSRIQGSGLILLVLLLTGLSWAEQTKIIIIDETPEAYRLNRERAERAQERRERKRERAHEIELATIEANKEIEIQRLATQARATQTTPRRAQAESSRDVQTVSTNSNNRRASFFNGGVFTGFSNPGFAGFGFNAGFQGPGFWGGGFQRGGFRRGGFRGGARRGGFRRGCR